MPEKLKPVKKKDFLIIAGILVAALCIWAATSVRFSRSQAPYAEIRYDGNLIKTIYLDEPQTFSVDPLPQVIFEVKDGSVAFIHSDCPDQICVHTGWLNRSGQFAACLPNKVTLQINSGQSGEGTDIIAK